MNADLEDENSPSFKKTSFVQPVVYTLSVLADEITQAKFRARISPKFVAGHSLGEYSALTKAGVLAFEDGIEIVTFRGKVMQEDCDKTESAHVSIRGSTDAIINEILRQTGAEVALINAPNLIVLGATRDRIPEIVTLAQNAKTRITILETAGAFHTSFMQNSADKLNQFLNKFEFKDPQISVIPNLTGEVSNSGWALRNHVVENIINPVQWAKSLKTMQDLYVRIFGEAGPGRFISQLNRLNGIPENQTINILELSA